MSSNTPTKLLIAGLIPTSSDVPEYFRQLYGNAEEIQAKIDADTARIRAAGYDVTVYYVDDKDAKGSLEWLENKLRTESFHGIAMGSGLRLLPPQTVLFENVVDVCRRNAPGSVFMFNWGPGTNFETVERNLPRLEEVKKLQTGGKA
ncbi:hypothetical protein BS50DRAFT_570781 [Corynespora cassiicola Philippines]|uniref:Uncharacterized protein n=1 Tax=Corynespora cassiicola Philippines TaxID=1448308 RepID=A0A2T2P180_CORCC|nr:hypothetical protein BS50DRAFT_570781 [Corynespora cassiicola Philippines]